MIIEWEYKTIYVGAGGSFLEDVLNDWGTKGWELVSLNNETYIAILKRQKF